MPNKKKPMRVLYLYAGKRKAFYKKWKSGMVGDTQLLGLNHMESLGISAKFLEWPISNWLRKINFNLVHLPYIFIIWRFDIVFINAGLPLVFIAKNIFRLKTKFVIYNTSLSNTLSRNNNKSIRGIITRKAIENIDRIICTAENQRKNLIERGFNPEKILFHPIGIDADFFTKLYRSSKSTQENTPNNNYIVSVGRDLGRDYATLFEAVKNLPIKIKLATKKETLAGLTIPTNVEIEYNIPYERMSNFYQNAIFAIVPLRDVTDPKGSDTSGQYGFLEPMACGKAVIATDKDTVRDYIEDGIDGILVPHKDPSALRVAIEDLLKNPKKAEILGIAAQKKVMQKFTSYQFAKYLAFVFKSIKTNYH